MCIRDRLCSVLKEKEKKRIYGAGACKFFSVVCLVGDLRHEDYVADMETIENGDQNHNGGRSNADRCGKSGGYELETAHEMYRIMISAVPRKKITDIKT